MHPGVERGQGGDKYLNAGAAVKGVDPEAEIGGVYLLQRPDAIPAIETALGHGAADSGAGFASGGFGPPNSDFSLKYS